MTLKTVWFCESCEQLKLSNDLQVTCWLCLTECENAGWMEVKTDGLDVRAGSKGIR